MLMDVNGVLYQHEVGTDDNGHAMDAYVEFSPVDVSNGSTNVDIFAFTHDFMRQTGDVSLSIETRLFPTELATVSGPYTIPDDRSVVMTDLRCDGNSVGFKIESDVMGGDFRFGIPRLEIQLGGERG